MITTPNLLVELEGAIERPYEAHGMRTGSLMTMVSMRKEHPILKPHSIRCLAPG